MSEPSDETHDQPPQDVARIPPPDDPKPAPTFTSGEAIPGLSSWVLERKLGGGGFGEVWLAKHAWSDHEKPRAVKFCTDPTARHRLVTHEKNVVLRVMKYAGDHPNIVPLVDCNLEGEVPWLMYEFVEGGTLAGLIEQWRELPMPKRLGRAVRTLYAIAGALAKCHRFDPPLIHRDLKPQNVLMAGSIPRITDFGIGGVVIPSQSGGTSDRPTVMAARVPTGLQTSGTRLYAPPEQLFGAAPNPRDDVYALGVIAFQALMGDLKTGPGADAELELRDLKIPSELTTLIVRSVAINPDRRPKDASEWEGTLSAILQRAQKHADPMSGASSGFMPALNLDVPAAVLSPPPDREPNGTKPLPIPTEMRPPDKPLTKPTNLQPPPLPPPLPLPAPALPPVTGRSERQWAPIVVGVLVVALIVIVIIALRGR